jgi:hypothetical protein
MARIGTASYAASCCYRDLESAAAPADARPCPSRPRRMDQLNGDAQPCEVAVFSQHNNSAGSQSEVSSEA